MQRTRSRSVLASIVWSCAAFWAAAAGAAEPSQVDILIHDGEIYDGSGGAPYRGDLAIRGDRVVAIGPRLAGYRATKNIEASGRAVAPGFINVLSWAPETLIQDGRGMSDILQGVTLELFGEGDSMGPLTPRTRDERLRAQTDVKYPIEWTTLSEYLEYLVRRGVSPNVASFVGAATLRTAVVGFDDRAPTAEELGRMQELVRAEMRNGALGIGSALIYAPGTYAGPDEIRALVAAAAEFGGGYSSHMRNEGDRLLEALDEIIDVGRTTGAHVEVHHFKAAGTANWPKMRIGIERIVKARADGVKITANMYPYIAGATGLDAAMPPWVQEGGNEAWFARLKDPAVRARVIEEMRKPGDNWDNLYAAAGSPKNVMFIGFRTEALKPFTGKTVDEVARLRGRSPEDTIVDLVIEDGSRIETAYFHMSEDNVRMGLQQPWVSLESDAEAMMPEGVFLKSNPHPRAYGAFARFLGRYVRDQRVTTLPEAIRRLTRLPAENWKLRERGCIDPGCHADIVIFDPRTITDHATFERPHQLAMGVDAVFINGVQVVRDGKHTDARPGQVVRGPSWTGWSSSAR
ncbi:MAG TPA: D-aminoacylase [Steroidobacter sp.]